MADIDDVAASVKDLDPAQQKALSVALNETVPRIQMLELTSSLASALSAADQRDFLTKSVAALPTEAKKAVVAETVAGLSPDDQAALARQFGNPSDKTRDYLWTIVICAFSVVLVGGFVTLAIGIFSDKPKTPIASAELVLTMFTSAVGFLAGLFVPSPVKR